jgi:hypothetical protein
VCLATAIAAFENQPPLGLLCIGECLFVGGAQVVLHLWIEAMAVGDEGIKGHAREEPQIAGTAQVVPTPLRSLLNPAPARDRTAKVRIAGRQVEPEVAESVAEGTDIAFWQVSA